MTRRPKLSLSPENKDYKKQAPGFDSIASPHEPETMPGATAPSTENRENPSTTKWAGKIAQPADTWSTGKVVKVFLVAAAAALSLYLLKRRLM